MDRLFDLSGQYKQLVELASSAEPEDAEMFRDTLEALEGEIQAKADGIAAVRMNLLSRSEMVAKEINRLRALEDSINNSIKRLENYTKACLEDMGVTEVKTDLHKLKIVKNGGLQPLSIDEANVPEEYTKTEIKISPDKDKIRAALKDGKELEFARLEERGTHLKID